jgi:HK97 family phage portal protein
MTIETMLAQREMARDTPLPPIIDAGWGNGYGPGVWDATTARRIPAVGKALGVYSGMLKQTPLDAWRGIQPLPRPRLLDRPDPTNARSWFVQNCVEDYLLNGNAVNLITARGPDGWPTACAWIPASWVFIQWWPGGPTKYFAYGQELPSADVVHIKRGADRWYPVRGVGIVEEYLGSLARIAGEEAYEASALADGAVPSVAVIAPNPQIGQAETDAAKTAWVTKFGGGKREPAILPNGTQVIPLSWSPEDAQLTEARRMSLTDVANMFNLDGYWLGAASGSMTYRSPGPMYLNLLRTSVLPVAVDFEDVWSDAWLPRGQGVRFDRTNLLRDDMQTTSLTLSTLVSAGIMSVGEAREYLTLPAENDDLQASVVSPVATQQSDPQSDDATQGEGTSGEGLSNDDG